MPGAGALLARLNELYNFFVAFCVPLQTRRANAHAVPQSNFFASLEAALLPYRMLCTTPEVYGLFSPALKTP
jgi:hypothetical protein